MKPTIVALTSILLVLTAGASVAGPIDDLIHSEMEKAKIPGLSLVIVRGDQVLKQSAYGLSDIEHSVPVAHETVFQSASVHKQFTAAMILLLRRQGKVQLNHPLALYFDSVPSSWHTISIRHLLTHTSGLKDYTDALDLRRDYTEDQLLAVAKTLPLEFQPGSQWSYSNTGYMLLGILISKITGEHWSEYARKHIFDPLEMPTADMISEAKIVHNRASGYVLKDGSIENQSWVSPSLLSTADGSLYISTSDLIAWELGLQGEKLLDAGSKSESWSPVLLSSGISYPYGFGWFIDEQRGYKMIHHGGAWQGFRVGIARYPDKDIMIAILINIAPSNPMRIIREIAGLVDASLQLPSLKPLKSSPDVAQNALLLRVLRSWSTWHSTSEMGRGLASAASGSARESYYRKQVGSQIDDMKSFDWLEDETLLSRSMRRRGESIAKVAHYVLQTSDEKIRYRFYLTSDGRVADFANR